MQIEYKAPDNMATVPLSHILKNELMLSTRLINKLKVTGGLRVNGLVYRTIDPVKAGDTVQILIAEDVENYTEAENIPIHILYEDDWFLAVNKQPGMPVHPSAGHQTGTLANAVQWHFLTSGFHIKTRPINRLDKDTSGITLFAKHSHAQDAIIRQMKTNSVYKEYLGIIEGVFEPEKGTIDLPIMRKPSSVMERIIHPDGDRSITHYETLSRNGYLSLVRFVLETGRTHQIRVHARAMGHPLLGDWLYSNNDTKLIGRQALHSHKLAFIHPASHKMLELTAPLPDDMQALISCTS